MTKSDGQSRIDGVELGEVSLTLLGPSSVLTAKYALCNTTLHARFGSGNRNSNWSAKTLEKVKDLVASMEEDICSDIFEGSSTTASVQEEPMDTYDGVPGL